VSISKQEEIISALWFICSLLAFIAGFKIAGWFFAIKAGGDMIFALVFAYKEAIKELHIKGKS